MDKMVDHSCDEATEESMREVIMGVKGVKGIDLLQTRLFGSKMYVDIEISADGEIPLNEAHDIAENVHHSIEIVSYTHLEPGKQRTLLPGTFPWCTGRKSIRC